MNVQLRDLCCACFIFQETSDPIYLRWLLPKEKEKEKGGAIGEGGEGIPKDGK